MKAVIAAGGTAGHINPALAIADEIMRCEPQSEIVFMGRKDGMEQRLVTQRGYQLQPIDVRGFMRGFTWKKIKFNAGAVRRIFTASAQAKAFLRSFAPDVVIGCGGYVSGPVVREAAKLGIPTAIHEQNSFPGVTSRLLSGKVDLIFAANADAAEALKQPEKTTVCGNPINREILVADGDALRRELGIGNRCCVLSFGGSLGAATINRVMAHTMAMAAGRDDIFFLHATGQYGEKSFPEMLSGLGADAAKLPARISTYITDMPQCLAAADLVVSRSGAITISELAAAGKAGYLIPSPNVSENHQYFNALTLAKHGAAIVEEEKELDAQKTAEKILALAADQTRLNEMGLAARKEAVADAAQRVYRHVRAHLDNLKNSAG